MLQNIVPVIGYNDCIRTTTLPVQIGAFGETRTHQSALNEQSVIFLELGGLLS